MKNVRRVFSMMLVVIVVLSLCVPIVHADNGGIKVMLNGEYINFDVEPQIVNGRTMVPFRAIFEAMGAEVSWNQELWQASGKKGDKTVNLVIDSNEISVVKGEEEQVISIDQAPIIIDSRTMVPVRFVAQAFNKIVSWDNASQTVIILDLEYFIDLLKEKASNFYECISATTVVPESLKSEDQIAFNMSMTTGDETEKITIDVQADTIMNSEDAYIGFDLVGNLQGDDSKIEAKFKADAYLKETEMIIKTNILGDEKIEFNGKEYSLDKEGCLIKYSDLGIPGFNTYQDIFKLFENKENTIDELSNYINNELYNATITVQDVRKLIKAYELTLDLVSNEKFVKKSYTKGVKYTWDISKADIEKYIKNLVINNVISISDIDQEGLQEVQAIIKDFNISTEIKVENNYPISSIIKMNFEAKEGTTEVQIQLNGTEKISGVNKGPHKINHPDASKALNIMEYYKAQQERTNVAQEQYNLSDMQNAVTIYTMNYMFDNATQENRPTFEEALSTIAVFSSTGEFIAWKENAKDLLGVDPTGYIVTIDGIVQKAPIQ